MKNVLFLLMVFTLAGCAAGNTYDYRKALTTIPLSGSGEISVEVVDQRPYILSGDKPATFIGLQRGGYGNPFNVNTTSEAPLADDLRVTITTALEQRGYTIVGPEVAAKRRIQLQINEWKTDVMMRMKVLYDLVLNVFDTSGTLLASSATQGEEVLGGGMQTANEGNANSTFELKFTQLVRDKEIKAALEDF